MTKMRCFVQNASSCLTAAQSYLMERLRRLSVSNRLSLRCSEKPASIKKIKVWSKRVRQKVRSQEKLHLKLRTCPLNTMTLLFLLIYIFHCTKVRLLRLPDQADAASQHYLNVLLV